MCRFTILLIVFCGRVWMPAAVLVDQIKAPEASRYKNGESWWSFVKDSSQCLKKLLIVRGFSLVTLGCRMWYPVVRQKRVPKTREFTVRKHHRKFDLCDSIQYLLLCKSSRLNLAFWWACWNGNRGQQLPAKHGRLGPRVFARFLIFLSAWVRSSPAKQGDENESSQPSLGDS